MTIKELLPAASGKSSASLSPFHTDANGRTTFNIYDPVTDRLSEQTDHAGDTLTYTYKPDGSRATATRTTASSWVTTSYGYDPARGLIDREVSFMCG